MSTVKKPAKQLYAKPTLVKVAKLQTVVAAAISLGGA